MKPERNLNYKFSLIIFIGLVIAVIALNVFIPSYVNGFSLDPGIHLPELWKNENSLEIINDRMSDPVFYKRMSILKIQLWSYSYLGLPYQASFNLINLISLAGITSMLYLISQNVFRRTKIESLNILCLFLTFLPIMFAFGGYVSSYDDWLQYFLVLSLIWFFFMGNMWLTALILFISMVVRETSFIYVVPLLLLQHSVKKHVRLIYILIALVLFIFYWLQIGNNTHAFDFIINQRFTVWKSNFSSFERSLESFICIFWILGLPVLLLYKKFNVNKEAIILFWVVIINTLIVVCTALVHETRLLFLSILILFPMLKIEVSTKLLSSRAMNINSYYVLGSLLMIGLVIYEPSVGRSALIYKFYFVLSMWIYWLLFPFIEFNPQSKLNRMNLK